MKHTLAERVADNLKRYPPFHLFIAADLIEVASHIDILYLEKGKVVFAEGDAPHQQFYVVHKGAISIEKKRGNQMQTLDKCDEGDIFGLRPLFAQERYQLAAIAEEESILYAIPIDRFKPLLAKNLRAGAFLLESFASNTPSPYVIDRASVTAGQPGLSETATPDLHELQPVRIVKKLITIKRNTSVTKVAQLMQTHGIGSVVIEENEIPIGIVTDKDLRRYVAGGTFDGAAAVETIMSAPVICYPPGITIAQAQITMLKHQISHIVITKDGTPNSPVAGIVSEQDIMVSQGNNPSALMKAINRAQKTKELKKIRRQTEQLLKAYLENNLPLTHISKIIFELNDATIKRVIELRLQKSDTPPPATFCWLSLGSQGRKEQLLATDQDNAIIFADVPEEQLEATRTWFVHLAEEVNKRLNTIGFEYCPAEMMARNPKYCLSLSEWKEQFTQWISKPGADEILLCSIFFDFDISYGNVSLSKALAEHIFTLTENHQLFLTLMAQTALLNPSPLGFFRQFLVESNGEHKDFFDLKKRALMPITDVARLLILQHRVQHINNTFERYEKLAELEPQNKEIYRDASYATKALLKFRAKQGVMHRDSGRYIELNTLTKEERMKLKRCFKTVRDLQELVKLRFKITGIL